MISKKRGFTLLELQMASVLMIVVLIATGVIFYFALASIRFIHDAAMVYSNANAAMKTLTNEIMVSNCWGNGQGGGFATPQYSFYGIDGYVHGIEQDIIGSGTEANFGFGWMPAYGGGTDALYLRQASQTGGATVAGDFPNHDSLVIYKEQNAFTGIDEMHVEISSPGGFLAATGGGDYTVAHHVTDFSFLPIANNCVAVQITVTGDVQSLIPDANGDFEVNNITLGKMITLRCAPTIRPWE